MAKLKEKRYLNVVDVSIIIALISIFLNIMFIAFEKVSTQPKGSSNTQIVRMMNNALKEDSYLNGKKKHETMYDAVVSCKEYGFSPDVISAEINLDIAWESNADRFVILDRESSTAIFPINEEVNQSYSILGKEEKYFVVSQANDYMENLIDGYSIYAYGKNWPAEITVNSGFDCGDVTSISKINFDSEKNNSVLIRTNGNSLNILSDYNTVDHYGFSPEVKIESTVALSYNEYGVVAKFSQKGDSTVYLSEESQVFCYENLQSDEKVNLANQSLLSSRVYSYVDGESSGNESNHMREYDVVQVGDKRYSICKKCGSYVVNYSK